MFRLCLFVGVFCVGSLRGMPSVSDDYAMREWHMQDGLPSEQIGRIEQDPAGYLWAATVSGMARFDGTHFERYPLTEDGTAYTRMTAMSSTLGLIAVPYARRGLVILRDGVFEPWRPEELGERVITGLFAEAGGALWVACDDGSVVRHADGKSVRFDSADGLPRARNRWFASDAGGQVWIVSEGTVMRYQDGEFIPLAEPFDQSELRIGSSTRGGPWLITRDRLLRVENERVIELARLPRLLGAHYVQAVQEARDGTLWVGTRSQGLYVLTEEGLEQVPTSHEDIFTLCEDRDGNMWVGTNGGGLNRIRRKTYRLYDKSSGLFDNQTHTICEDSSGNVWFANRDGGVARLRHGVIEVIAARDWPRMSAISIFPLGSSEMGVTTGTGGYSFAREDAQTAAPIAALPMPGIRATYAARNGDVWLSLYPDRVGRLRDGSLEIFGRSEGMDGRLVRGIAEDADGRIWVGAADGKLFRTKGDGKFEPVSLGDITPGAIQAIRIEDDGTVWLGTVSGGIVVLANGRVLRCTERNGLPDMNITQILADDHGYLWFGSKRGVFRLSRKEIMDCLEGTIPRVTPFVIGQDEGLKDLSCQGLFQPAACRSRDGLLWFATRRGVLSIDPAVQLASPAPSLVKIEEVRCDEQRVPLVRPFHVAAGVRKLEIRFGVLNLSAPDRVHAWYRLDGFDDNWVIAPPSRVAAYPRLPPGKYRFHVMASGGGMVNQAGDAIDFTVEPLWWQTWLFRVGAVLCAIMVVVLAVRSWSHRRLRGKLGKMQRERAIEQERRRIAQNIHDDLGASLTRVSLLTQQARQENAPGAAYFDEIHLTAAEITRSMDEIVWAVNPRHDHLESVAGYIGDFAQNFLRLAGIRCRLDIPVEMPAVSMTSQTRHHLFLCCKEALNNIVKHARADEAVVAIRTSAQQLVISIRDNGKGHSTVPAPQPNGNRDRHPNAGMGLEGMRQRMAEIGGRFEIAIHPGEGTVVTLTLLFARSLS